MAPVVRLARLVRLLRQVLIAAELLFHRVHVVAGAVVRALDGLVAAQAELVAGLRARHALVGGAMAVDVDAARAVRPRAGDLVAAAASVLGAGRAAQGRRHRCELRRRLGAHTPEVRLAALVGLAVQVLIAVEGLIEGVEVPTAAAVRALDRLGAGKAHLLARF